MSYKVAIRKNETGEIRFAAMSRDWSFTDCPLLWTEGNYGCDCNREALWERAGGVEYDHSDHPEDRCGTGRFAAIYAEMPDGSKWLLDEPDLPGENNSGNPGGN